MNETDINKLFIQLDIEISNKIREIENKYNKDILDIDMEVLFIHLGIKLNELFELIWSDISKIRDIKDKGIDIRKVDGISEETIVVIESIMKLKEDDTV